MKPSLRVALLILLSPVTLPGVSSAQQGKDSSEVVATVAAFHQALAQGDSAAALGLLAPDVVVLEAGGIESREEYRSHHLSADIAFARAVAGVTGPIRAVVVHDVAWATSTSIVEGTFQGRRVDSQGAEIMVLSRSADGWRIRAIHWSSRARRR